MGNLKITKHRGVTCAGGTVKLFGSRLDIYIYVVDGLLVDTGPSRFAADYINFFRTQSIEQVVLTHFHEDHSGNAPWLDKQGIPIYINPASVPFCLKKARLPLYRRYFWGKREPFKAQPLGDTLQTTRREWRVLEVPGHCIDHIALYDPREGAMYTGDLFVAPKTKIIMRDENIHQIIRSLQLLLQYDFNTVYCGHAGVVENGREMVTRKLQYLEELKKEVLELHRRGMNIRAINKRIYPKTAPLTYLSGKEWASEHIIRSIIKDN
ncbi:MBL fold metallo-hydrolase [Desulfallas thermosapovorans]|uniref:Glyoxylase-like metal-dependent hydrolase (Beta-lactamase superfamily II) n=1 Tax=Desulfallas thermosapovorans DSM 6562 TaxID=1121431 RepID=A0A5S4ZRF4_9FIRM|nr:MBL fold metallo-hydrolase [Desulfallas thermosapovorans]TYO95414.1 glyoxylase-like metal-dependent hydrolase (beta-lactamase superfamily II) [Desulfallas thermosapovorans DSM 6562]